jgi:hypothetical protein
VKEENDDSRNMNGSEIIICLLTLNVGCAILSSLGRNLALEVEMLELQKSTIEGHKVASQLQKALEEKLQQQQDALWVSVLQWPFFFFFFFSSHNTFLTSSTFGQHKQRFRPETLQSKLRSAASESEELSESVAQSFLEGKLDQEGFIRQYRDLRKVYHLRTMKHERMGPILRNHAAANIGNSANNIGLGLDASGSSIVGGTSGPGGTGGGDSWVLL